jgi:hypothetical protein
MKGKEREAEKAGEEKVEASESKVRLNGCPTHRPSCISSGATRYSMWGKRIRLVLVFTITFWCLRLLTITIDDGMLIQ